MIQRNSSIAWDRKTASACNPTIAKACSNTSSGSKTTFAANTAMHGGAIFAFCASSLFGMERTPLSATNTFLVMEVQLWRKRERPFLGRARQCL